MNKVKIIAVSILLLLAGAAIIRIKGFQQGGSTQAGRQQQRIAVRTANPGLGTLRVTRSFTGEISGSDQAVIYSEAPGRLHSYLIREGEEVKKDQVIALIDREMTGMDFEQLRVRSPINGTVTRLYLGRGDTVTQQTPLAVAAKLDKVKASFHVPEKDLQFVSRENPVILRVTAWPGVSFSGRVSRFSLSLERSSRTAYAEALFDNPERKLMPGMFAELEIISREIEDVLTLPESAVLRDPDGAGFYIFTSENETAVRTNVETGYRQNDSVQILSGVGATDRVIIEGQYFLQDGQEIRESR